MHYPIDANGRSIVALYVAGTTINGFEYPTGRGTFTCDVNDPDDEDPIPDEGGDLPDLPPDLPDDVDPDPDGTEWPPNIPEPSFPAGGSGTDGGNDSAPSGGINNPADPIDSVDDEDVGGGGTIGGVPADRPLLPGDTLTYYPACAGGYTEWWLCPPPYVANNVGVLEENLAQSCELIDVGVGSDYVVSLAAAGQNIVAIGRCPDPGSPDGFGPATGAVATDEVGGESGILFRPEAGYYSISWLGFYIATIGSTSAPNGISIYASDKDGFCGGGDSYRLWYSYINNNGSLVDTVWNSLSGCTPKANVLYFATVRFFFNAGGSVTLWTNGAPV